MKNMFWSAAVAPLLMASAAPGDFPGIEGGWLDVPEVIAVDTVKGVMIGMSRQQVHRQLGAPHFNEGIRARTWNYMFDLRSKGQSAGMTCALQLVYEAGRVKSIDWQTESCATAAK